MDVACNYFNVYELVDENGSKDGFYCALFTGEMPPSAATVESVTDTAGNAVNVTSSWGYRVYTPDEDVVYVVYPFVPNLSLLTRLSPEYTPLETEPKANTSTAIIPVVHVYQASNTTTAVESSESPCSTSTTTETWLLQEYTATTMETVTTSQSASSTA
jgi:hypothetical protein